MGSSFPRGMSVVMAALFILAAAAATLTAGPTDDQAPNVVIIVADDLGFGDLGCYGRNDIATPRLDQMAREGARMSDFYVAQAVCSASRVALLTGCYPNRLGILGALGPASKIGIHPEEQTLAELLRSRGYATAAYGKWHLGGQAPCLARSNGFDEFFGLPYSNDMWPKHPTNRSFPDLPLLDGERIAGLNPDQNNLTRWYTEHALDFIRSHKQTPFFLYLAHSMPHVPLHVSDAWRGRSMQGLYGDVIQEIDNSVGRILDEIKTLGMDERTLVIFTSDNGPWLSYGNHAGSAGALREGKGTSFEGGVRVPAIFRWPGRIPAARVSCEPAMTIDLVPTIARLANVPLDADRKIDGLDIWELLSGTPGATSPHEALYFYWDRELQAVRSGPWKLHFPHAFRTLAGEPGRDGVPGDYVERSIGLSLFNLMDDVGEQHNLADEHPDIVRRIMELADQARDDLGDSARQQIGRGVRQPWKF